MATVEESFVYPLVLLLVGAGVSGVLVAWLTDRWAGKRSKLEIDAEDRRKKLEMEVADHRKELEIKVDIESKIFEVIGTMSAKASFSSDRRKAISNLDEHVEKFLVDIVIIFSMLRSYYFSEASIEHR